MRGRINDLLICWAEIEFWRNEWKRKIVFYRILYFDKIGPFRMILTWCHFTTTTNNFFYHSKVWIQNTVINCIRFLFVLKIIKLLKMASSIFFYFSNAAGLHCLFFIFLFLLLEWKIGFFFLKWINFMELIFWLHLLQWIPFFLHIILLLY